MNKHIISKSFKAFLILILILIIPFIFKSHYWKSVFILISINILLVFSLRTIRLIGFISLGQVGFAAIGAYTSALLVLKAGLSCWLSIIIAGLLAGFVSIAIGYAFLKTKGMYFTILTLLTAETIRNIFYYWTFSGASMGLTNIPSYGSISFKGVILDFSTINGQYILTSLIVFLSLIFFYFLEHSKLNFRWRAICDDEILAKSIGFNTCFYKIVNFSIACFFAGIAGGLLAFYQCNLSADIGSIFGALSSIYLIIYLAIGGESSFIGPIFGTAGMMLLFEFTRSFEEFQNMLIGFIAIFIMLFLPSGLTSLFSNYTFMNIKQKYLKHF